MSTVQSRWVRWGVPLVLAVVAVWLVSTREGFVSPLPNGKVMITTSGAITSIFYYMVNRILPDRLKVAGPPKAGLLPLEPR